MKHVSLPQRLVCLTKQVRDYNVVHLPDGYLGIFKFSAVFEHHHPMWIHTLDRPRHCSMFRLTPIDVTKNSIDGGGAIV
eukprot:scaffold90121_cov30-Tisochrysis_lutea.AAC.14